MKILLTTLLACGIALAQTPAAKAPAAAPKAAPAAGPDLLKPQTLTAKAPETFKVKFTTTKGDVIIEVTRAWAPLGADRFYNLVKGGFYKDAAFFRVLPRFVAQFGIPARPVDRKLPRQGNRQPDFDPYGMPCDDSLDPLLRDLEGLRAELTEVEARVARLQASQGEFGQAQGQSQSREPAAE